jgi:hypothetical protein
MSREPPRAVLVGHLLARVGQHLAVEAELRVLAGGHGQRASG